MTLSETEAYDSIVTSIDKQKSDSTASEYIRHVSRFRDWMDERERSIFEADSLYVEEHFEHMLDEGYSPSTVRVRKAGLSTFFKRAMKYSEAGRIDAEVSSNPTESVKLGRWTRMSQQSSKQQETNERVFYLKPNEVEELASHVPTPTLRNELIIRLLFQTGMRRGELCRLRLSDVELDTRVLSVSDTKSDTSRKVRYQPSIDFLMRQWIEVQRESVGMADESEYLFPTGRSLHLSGNRLNGMVRIAAENAGLQRAYGTDMNGNERHEITAHVLRHSFAMECVRQGWDVYYLKEAMGHHDISVTVDNYLHGAQDDVLEEFRRKGPNSE
ncbi:site-specific integrase [Haladaptatus sp. DJG-WS-42]|uniref:tyrosine-type recombinase/integrase n=1 Tax=Haladaptatus sp. DJG-WS-42 TaxID=3120516 RepID=UPI0030CA6189